MNGIDDAIKRYRYRRQKRLDDKWITVNGGEGKGQHILVNNEGVVKAGAGGALNGKKFGGNNHKADFEKALGNSKESLRRWLKKAGAGTKIKNKYQTFTKTKDGWHISGAAFELSDYDVADSLRYLLGDGISSELQNYEGSEESEAERGEFTQKQLEKDYKDMSVDELKPEERYELAEKYAKEDADKSNYYVNSVGFWDEAKKPKREPDHVSRTKTGEISSEYWYTDEGVFRRSNHWGSDVASCSWYINGSVYGKSGIDKGKRQTAFIRWSDLKPKGSIIKDHKTGEYKTFGFTFDK